MHRLNKLRLTIMGGHKSMGRYRPCASNHTFRSWTSSAGQKERDLREGGKRVGICSDRYTETIEE